MRRISSALGDAFKKGDMFLLFLCLIATGFGCVCIASATNYMGSSRFIIVQLAATAIGIVCYFLLTCVDVEIIAERKELLFVFNVFLILLLIPFGTDGGTGNRSWLDLPGFPVMIQPAEICKISFTILLAKVMSNHKNHISHPKSVLHMAAHMIFLVGLIVVISRDDGVALIFVFIFIIMAFAGGVSLWWFVGGAGALAAAMPLIWTKVMDGYQRQRILMIFDPTVDPDGQGIRWQTVRSLRSLTGGGLSGQGLFHGSRTQSGVLFAQHTDFIFSSIGEELGLIGCLFTLFLLCAIIGRCIYVGLKTPSYLGRMVCIGTAAAMIFQVLVNIGMCIGVMPVIGLTLPFISYGGSSIVSMYLAMGVVSSVRAHPGGGIKSAYIQPRY